MKIYSLAESVAPRMSTVGRHASLYATPSYIICMTLSYTVLVMTSANPSGLPILYKDEEALSLFKAESLIIILFITEKFYIQLMILLFK